MDSVKELFADLLINSCTITVDPMQCIPFTCVRKVVNGCVRELMNIFDANNGGGITSGGSMASVVLLEGVFGSVPLDYFTQELGSKEKALEVVSPGGVSKLWYGIVDGGHRNAAIRLLMLERPSRWAGFMWTVTLLSGTASRAMYKSYARMCNTKQEHDFIICQTQYDVLRSMKDEYVSMHVELGRQATPIEVAERYAGGAEKCSSTHKQLSRTANRLSDAVIEEVGKIVNEDHPSIAKSQHPVRSVAAEETAGRDYRIYRKIISTSTFKQSKTFMNASGPLGKSYKYVHFGELES